jgi:nucleotide-binding universal stress UspA family protein
MKRLRWIVVGTDFSPAADRALDHAAELATELDASIAVVHAYEDPPGARFDSDPAPGMRAHLEQAAAPIRTRHPSLRVDCLVRRGAPWDKLVNVASDLGAQMIVVGAGGERSSAEPSFLGSVVTRVAAASKRSVLVVPTREPDAGSPHE